MLNVTTIQASIYLLYILMLYESQNINLPRKKAFIEEPRLTELGLPETQVLRKASGAANLLYILSVSQIFVFTA